MKWFIRIFIGLGLIIFGGGSLMMLWFEYGFPWQHGQKKQVMETYLEDKYKDSFALGGLRYDVMHGRNYFTYATAASTGVSFYVEVSPDDEVDDGYGYEYWNVEVQQLFEPLLNEALGQYERVDGDVFLNKLMDKETFDVDAASFAVYVAMGKFLEEQKLEDELTRSFAVVEAIRAAELSIKELVLRYYDKEIRLDAALVASAGSPDALRDIFEHTAYRDGLSHH